METGELVTRRERPAAKPSELPDLPKPAPFVAAGAPPSTVAEVDALHAAWVAEAVEAESRIARLDAKIAEPRKNWLLDALKGREVDPADLVRERDSLQEFCERRRAHLRELAKFRPPLEVAALAHGYATDVHPKLVKALGTLAAKLQDVEGFMREIRPLVDEGTRLHDVALAKSINHQTATGECADGDCDTRVLALLRRWFSTFVADAPNPTRLSVWLDEVRASGFEVGKAKR